MLKSEKESGVPTVEDGLLKMMGYDIIVTLIYILLSVYKESASVRKCALEDKPL